jgi:hypothetical protein
VAQEVAPTAPPKSAAENKGTKPPAPTGRITGTVVCADTHRPARGAMVLVGPVSPTDGNNGGGLGSGMARVGMDGTYTLEHLPRGEYSVIAILPGYLWPADELISDMVEEMRTAKHKSLASLGTVTIAGSETEEHDITLERGAAVSGRVMFSDGAPASGVTISIEDVNAKKVAGDKQREAQMGASMMRRMFVHESMDTDDQGHFRISGFKPGTYRVVAIPSLSSEGDTNDGEAAGLSLLLGGAANPAALRVYSGDTLHSKAAKTYELRSGDEVTGVEITIPLNAYHRVGGTLTAVDGRAINKATVTLTDTGDDSVSFESDVADDGSFSFGTVAAGTYTLAAKNATIAVRMDGQNPEIPMRFAQKKTTNAFADGSMAVIVKDSDVPDVSLTLTEVPLPPQPVQPTPITPDD